ncbi:MAG TPA: EamA family transporter, partial [Stellaceae bacterium]|nr:EamA family transporter [Stellaceae bacterium]
WISSPFQLALWETLLATTVLTLLAILFEGWPKVPWTVGLASAFAYSGVIGTALGFWAMAVVNRSVPASTTSLGILATPVVGIAISAFVLGERIDMQLIAATTLIVAGIAMGTSRAA